VFCDAGAVASTGFVVAVALLFALGFVERRLRALAWAAILVVSAFVADFLWQIGWEPFDRSDDYEAIPQTPFVLIGLPIPMAIVAAGSRRRCAVAPRPFNAEHAVESLSSRLLPSPASGAPNIGQHSSLCASCVDAPVPPPPSRARPRSHPCARAARRVL
jgi:hypothetical protein